jgi:uncharacterized protein (TIGR03437 family)
MPRRIVLLLFAVGAGIAGLASAQTPVITPGGTVSAASFAPGQPVAPGSLVAIFGNQFAGSLASADTVPLSTTLSNTSVSFNGIAAPLNFVAPGQINAQVPYEVLPAGMNGAVNVVVTRNGVASAPDPVNITQFAPGVFAANGHAIAIIATDPNDTARFAKLAAPAGSIPGLTTVPARPGDALIIYATGLGAVTPAVQSGHDSLDQLRKTNSTPTVLIGNVPATVFFSGLTPNFPGIYQLNVTVAAGTPVGDAQPLVIQIGGVTSPATATVAISAQ